MGCAYVRFYSLKFCPLLFGAHGYGDTYVPIGIYRIDETEIPSLIKHSQLVFAVTEESISMACFRLADAANRIRPQDQIVDAVIGMEAVLLAGIEDRRSELSFRFSLNYAMLFAVDRRKYAFSLARDLYGLRSKIAHGNTIDERRLKIAGEKIGLAAAGVKATEALRAIIMHFLPMKDYPYRKSNFWQKVYFGLPDQDKRRIQTNVVD